MPNILGRRALRSGRRAPGLMQRITFQELALGKLSGATAPAGIIRGHSPFVIRITNHECHIRAASMSHAGHVVARWRSSRFSCGRAGAVRPRAAERPDRGRRRRRAVSRRRGDAQRPDCPQLPPPSRPRPGASSMSEARCCAGLHRHPRARHAGRGQGLFEVPTADNYIRQGVTTIMDGPDGGSPCRWPLPGEAGGTAQVD